MRFIRTLFKRVLPEPFQAKIRQFRRDRMDVYASRSYSQEGEDMILRRIFEGQTQGFYVDVGAHHPRRFSNTYFYYRQGWSGINLDAMPGSMRLFTRIRPRDVNLEYAVGRSEGEAKYFVFNDPALNSFDENLSFERNTGPYRIVQELKIPVRTLKRILEEHLPSGKGIDFLTVDVEGMDLDVLQSNDWGRFRPRYVLVECLHLDLTQPAQDPVFVFLQRNEYCLIAKTVNTAVFQDMATARHIG
jgi:FkbM family methyltransferase